MNNGLLTIKEFSEAAGVSQQAIYKQINGRLKDYIVIVDGKTMLSPAALEKYYGRKVEEINSTHSTTNSTEPQPDFNENSTNEVEPSTQEVENIEEVKQPNSTDNEEKTGDEPINRIIDLLQKELEEKNKQLAIKDKQIEDLYRTLDKVIETNKGLTYISAAEKKTELLEAADNKEQQDNDIIKSPAAEDTKPKEKKSFWKRILGK